MKVIFAGIIILVGLCIMLYNMYSFHLAYEAQDIAKMIWYGVWVLFWALAWK